MRLDWKFTSFIISCNMILWTFTCDYSHQYMVVRFYGHYVRIEPLTHVFSVASVLTPTKFSVVLPSSLWGRGYDSKASHHTYDITHHVHWIKCCLGVVVVVINRYLKVLYKCSSAGCRQFTLRW